MRHTTIKMLKSVLGVFLSAVMLVNTAVSVRADKENPEDPMNWRSSESQPVGGDYGMARTMALEDDSVPFPSSGLLNHASAFAGAQKHYGIDVSDHNGIIDWAKAKAAGVEFAFVRVGWRGCTEGSVYSDTQAAANLAGAKAAGIKVGAYFYSQAITTAEAVEEANLAISVVRAYNPDLPIMYDREFDDYPTLVGRLEGAGLSQAAETAIVKAFCDKVKASGYQAGIYASTWWYDYRLFADQLPSDYQLWVADWASSCSYKGSYSFWQYSEKGYVNGVGTNVDMNVWYTGSIQGGVGNVVTTPVNSSWQYSGSGWRYVSSTGTYPTNQFITVNGSVYYVNSYGYRVTGWVQISGDYYYFNSNGVMATGWLQAGNGWHYMGTDGRERYGFQTISGATYYFDGDGVMQKGWKKISGDYYCFNSSGVMATGWLQASNGWHYMGTDGRERYGFQTVNGVTYYFDSDGVMQTGWQSLGGHWYYFQSSGAMTTGWYKTSGGWHYFNAQGIEQYGWVKVSGTWYYLNKSSGVMQTGWLNDGGNTYYLRSSGAMATGWVQLNSKWYYFTSSGAMVKNGWRQINGDWYYFYSNGVMAANTWIGSYYVNSSGRWVH